LRMAGETPKQQHRRGRVGWSPPFLNCWASGALFAGLRQRGAKERIPPTRGASTSVPVGFSKFGANQLECFPQPLQSHGGRTCRPRGSPPAVQGMRPHQCACACPGGGAGGAFWERGVLVGWKVAKDTRPEISGRKTGVSQRSGATHRTVRVSRPLPGTGNLRRRYFPASKPSNLLVQRASGRAPPVRV